MNRHVILAALMTVGCAGITLQAQERGGRNLPPGEMVAGKVTSVGKSSLVVTPLSGGDPVTVNIGDDTRIMKERQPARLGDIKANDIVFVRGQINGGAMTAVMVGVVNPEMAQRMQQGGFAPGRGNSGGGLGAGAGSFNREELGKKFIAGEVKAINETRLTITRPDGQEQEIEVDEDTSFRRGTESITLPDIKVGDFVRGAGELKNNVFVPKELIVGRPPRMRGGEPGKPPPPAATPKN